VPAILHPDATFARPAARTSSSVGPPQNHLPPTVTVWRMVALPQPSTRRAACAFEMPMKASGSHSPMQSLSTFVPMPGSMRTGTAPALKMAKNSAKNSRLGVTIRTVRMPRVMPMASSPAAMTSLSSSSWRNV
jgi:hypothetical protein